MGDERLAFTREPLEVATVVGVVSMFVHPVKSANSEIESFRIFGGLVGSGRSIKAEAHAIKMLAIAEAGGDLARVVQTPIESAILLIPQNIVQKLHAMLHDRQELSFQFRAAHYDLRGDPGHTRLEDGELAVARGGLPIACEFGMKATVFGVERAWEPDVSDVA